MPSVCLILASLLLSFAWLAPFHTYPWVTFSSELATFGAALALFSLFLNQNVQIPKLQLYILPVAFVPLLQWSRGLVSDFSVALLSIVYLLGFWAMVVMGYNLLLQPSVREQLMQRACWLLLIIASVTSLMAMIQWLGLESSVYGIMELKGNRPYANFGQPNNMATFLVMGLMGALYLYEKQKASVWLLASASLVILFAIALSQSRTSWVVCLFIFIYWIYKQFRQTPRLNVLKLSLWCAGFFAIAAWGIPAFTHAIESSTGTAVIEADSIVERASSGYLRFEIWTQMLLALKEQPWLGYGWNQTSVAQMTIFHLHPSHEWVTSGHNVLLDILVWNGIPLGLLIIAYMAVWLLWLNKNTKDTTSIVAMLMVSAILIHAMLEFPQRYAYFLLPMGFLLGLIQAQTPNLKAITLHKNVILGCWVLSLILLFIIWRDYKVFQENSQLLFKGQQPTAEIMGSSRILLLTQFQQRLVWIALKPTVSMSDQDLMQWGDMVKNKATPYNLKKYAQLLVYNQKMAEAEQQLFILQQLYGENIGLADIVEVNHNLK
ncbi:MULTISPECIES: O-antigen ligase family protein [unclassified Acinetobacter]|uniref:PglL family O-oligosaccharyltransferase n=1 Tax=unclassified Acinetobacter TaxID=196816 RepID=UPI002446F0EC|nr:MULTISPECIES: O-antigen ligase family protein [unclassified Acinetobacter]MDH0029843.1 Wzy polymerase domain-containing protein [Acinetobacter sp. GD04021]MDH0885393.1 Wzy polymerase domain-containing protein [Acinetobacter sp. GD03873]MDH1081511.1 Wzy polymerase domain-containing protein [Acinetobacter sp. GD03983]MDH2188708.1 Wzy polymerase domain-containing protein [Acinetobacter sp. GD03645]MDH2203431.1 Wzy polymerase domain-containing protein [Acinetobacter sp. GD03647]